MAGMGVSFVPGGQGDPQNRSQQGEASGAAPLQQAIQMLSLRLPRVVGANAMAPGQLLNAPGGMGGSGNPLLEALLRLAGMAGGGGMPSGMPNQAPSPMAFGSAPMPRFNPGGEDQRVGPQLQPPSAPPTNSAGPAGSMQGPGQTTFPDATSGSPFFNRGPYSRQM